MAAVEGISLSYFVAGKEVAVSLDSLTNVNFDRVILRHLGRAIAGFSAMPFRSWYTGLSDSYVLTDPEYF